MRLPNRLEWEARHRLGRGRGGEGRSLPQVKNGRGAPPHGFELRELTQFNEEFSVDLEAS